MDTGQHPLVSQLYFDGWYMSKGWAQAVAEDIIGDGATVLGIVERPGEGAWGVLYVSARELIDVHRLDSESALWSAVRPRD